MLLSRSLAIMLVCALVQASRDFDQLERYIKMPISGALQTRKELVDGGGIQSLDLDANSSPAEVLHELRSCAAEEGKCSEGEAETAGHLLELADGRDECSRGLLRGFLAAYRVHRFNKAKNAEAMLNFIKHYGRNKFRDCAPKAIAKIKSLMARKSKEFGDVEQFFKFALSLGKYDKLSDEVFYDELKRFEPLESKFDVDKLMRISKDFGPSATAAGRINAKFNFVCFTVLLNRVEFDILNIASSLAPKAKYFEEDPKLGQQNELTRVCKQAYWNDDLIEHLRKFCKPRHDLMLLPPPAKESRRMKVKDIMKKFLPCTNFSCVKD